jgi:hypothetical protein
MKRKNKRLHAATWRLFIFPPPSSTAVPINPHSPFSSLGQDDRHGQQQKKHRPDRDCFARGPAGLVWLSPIVGPDALEKKGEDSGEIDPER